MKSLPIKPLIVPDITINPFFLLIKSDKRQFGKDNSLFFRYDNEDNSTKFWYPALFFAITVRSPQLFLKLKLICDPIIG